jgi:hypothetical protein
MIIIYEPTASYQYFKVRTSPQGCSAVFDARLQLTDAETLVTSSYTPTTLFFDQFGFLNVEAQMVLSNDTPYKLEIIQLSASADCNTIYRGEIYITTGSAQTFDSKPFQSYDGLQTKYELWG